MEKCFSLYQKNLYNAWITTSKLRDSVTIRRIRLLLLRQNLKLTTILKGQVRLMALFCSYIHLCRYLELSWFSVCHLILVRNYLRPNLFRHPHFFNRNYCIFTIVNRIILCKTWVLEKGMHRSEPWNELTSNFWWEIHPMSVLISVQPHT